MVYHEHAHLVRDLCFRMEGAPLALPPLRVRPEEIPHLVHIFLLAWAR